MSVVVGGQVGEDRRACPARGKLNDDGEDVRVVVGVGIGPMEFKLNESNLRPTTYRGRNCMKKNNEK